MTTPYVIALADRLAVLRPPRRLQGPRRPTPYLGGAAVMAGFAVALLLAPSDWGRTLPLVGGAACSGWWAPSTTGARCRPGCAWPSSSASGWWSGPPAWAGISTWAPGPTSRSRACGSSASSTPSTCSTTWTGPRRRWRSSCRPAWPRSASSAHDAWLAGRRRRPRRGLPRVPAPQPRPPGAHLPRRRRQHAARLRRRRPRHGGRRRLAGALAVGRRRAAARRDPRPRHLPRGGLPPAPGRVRPHRRARPPDPPDAPVPPGHAARSPSASARSRPRRAALAVLASQGGAAFVVFSAILYLTVAGCAIGVLDNRPAEEFAIAGARRRPARRRRRGSGKWAARRPRRPRSRCRAQPVLLGLLRRRRPGCRSASAPWSPRWWRWSPGPAASGGAARACAWPGCSASGCGRSARRPGRSRWRTRSSTATACWSTAPLFVLLLALAAQRAPVRLAAGRARGRRARRRAVGARAACSAGIRPPSSSSAG